MTNEQLREGGMEDIVKAMEHDITDVPAVDPVEAYKAIEKGVVDTYQKIEDGVVGAYQKIENKFVEKFLAKDGESAEDAIKRVSKNIQK